MDICLSIIIPVYNASKYLNSFLDSLANQTYQNFETIFVYDNSDDETLSILMKYIDKHKDNKSIKLICNPQNRGAGYARDIGFKKVSKQSKFVMFLDCDDTFNNLFFEKMINRILETNADFVCCGYSRVNYETNKIVCEEMMNNPKETINISNLSFPLFLINTSTWNKIFKKSIAEKCYYGNAPRAEDFHFTLMAVIHSSQISFLNENLYTYYIHNVSRINTTTSDKHRNTLESFKVFAKAREDGCDFDLISSFVFVRLGIGMVIRSSISNKKEIKEIIHLTKNFLKKEFNVFGHNKYLSLGFLKKAGKKGFAIWLSKILYKIGLFRIVVDMYSRRIIRGNKEIRW